MRGRTFLAHAVIVCCFVASLACVHFAAAQDGVPAKAREAQQAATERLRNPSAEGIAAGLEASERLGATTREPNQYRGGVHSFNAVEDNMMHLFEKLLSDAAPHSDKFYSPHLRDIVVTPILRFLHAFLRASAGTIPTSFFGITCYGACSFCIWPEPWHQTPACCKGPTMQYMPLTTDNNFKTCCVREHEAFWTEEEIACTHPMGDGWAGLFEFYFPTTALGWENDRTSTMIVEKEKVDQCVAGADALMEGSTAVDWVSEAIARNVRAADGQRSLEEIKKEVSSVVQGVRPVDKKLRFSDSLQGGGLTMRVNFASMHPIERQALAASFCMHPDQFMKLMDPIEDPYQMPAGGVGSLVGMLSGLPIFANYCPNGVRLMTSVWQSAHLRPVDPPFGGGLSPTDLSKGFLAGFLGAGPLYCQAMHMRDNSFLTEEQRKIIAMSKTVALDEQMVGYSCKNNGQSWIGLSPVEMYRTAQVERRAPEQALGFLVAGGLYDITTQATKRSYYKRFEPMPYSKQASMFTGKPLRPIPGVTNELGMPCARPVLGKDYRGKNLSDQLYLSDKTHSFTQKIIGEVEGGGDADIEGWNKYFTEWTTNKQTSARGPDARSHNYAAASRMFASCPKGYTRWKGPHSENIAGTCGEEKLW